VDRLDLQPIKTDSLQTANVYRPTALLFGGRYLALFGACIYVDSQLTPPLSEGRFCSPLRWAPQAQQLIGVAQVTARVTTAANSLPFAETPGLGLACAKWLATAVRCEMAAPNGGSSSTLEGSAFHSDSFCRYRRTRHASGCT
jgi:hypothetical protein